MSHIQKTIKDTPKYRNGSKAIPKDEIVVQYSAFLRSHLNYLLEEKKRLEGEIIQDADMIPFGLSAELYSRGDGFNTAITQQLEHLEEEIKETKKLL
jgi:hypothetical protein